MLGPEPLLSPRTLRNSQPGLFLEPRPSPVPCTARVSSHLPQGCSPHSVQGEAGTPSPSPCVVETRRPVSCFFVP